VPTKIYILSCAHISLKISFSPIHKIPPPPEDQHRPPVGPTVWEPLQSSLCVQTSSEAHPASPPLGTGSPFPGGGGVKRSRGLTLTTHPHLEPRSIMKTSYTSSPPWRLYGGSGTVLFYFPSLLKALTAV
jgi:hypothetical protein